MMTYESASEAQVLKALWRPGAALENTLFAILAPNGQPLTRGARSPNWMFRDAHDMTAALNYVARQYQSRGDPQHLPVVATVRLGMNVAACDKRPLTIVVGRSEQERQEMESRLAPLAWSSDLIGEMTYTAGTSYELRGIQGVGISQGYLFVSPNEFGTAGRVLAQLYPTASTEELRRALKFTIDQHHPLQLDHREHIRLGREQGIRWTSAIPVTDPHSLWAEQHDREDGPDGFGPPPMRPWGQE